MALDPRELLKSFSREKPPETTIQAPLAGNADQKVQRLQVGLFGLVAMILVVALADIVVSRADETEASVVTEAELAPAETETAGPRDPLADAGLVPELPAETAQQPTAAHIRGKANVAPPTAAAAQ